jgi:hypothetical protein
MGEGPSKGIRFCFVPFEDLVVIISERRTSVE